MKPRDFIKTTFGAIVAAAIFSLSLVDQQKAIAKIAKQVNPDGTINIDGVKVGNFVALRDGEIVKMNSSYDGDIFIGVVESAVDGRVRISSRGIIEVEHYDFPVHQILVSDLVRITKK